MNTLLLKSIHDAIDKIDFGNPKQNDRAKQLCDQIFGLYLRHDCSFTTYQSLSVGYFKRIVPRQGNLSPILNALKINKILICDHKYDVKKKIPKGYKFNYDLIYGSKKIEFIQIKSGLVHNNVEEEIMQHLQQIDFDSNINKLILDTIEEMITKIILNEDITEEYFELKKVDAKMYNKSKNYVSRDLAFKLAKEKQLDLIKFNKRFFLDDLQSFVYNKKIELEIIYTKKVKEIIIGKHYASRNSTNNRLDYNLTNLKKELFDSLLFEKEKTIEIDIANAQFALLSYIAADSIDLDFVTLTQCGTLYSYIEQKLNLEKGKGKMLMFRIAFDKSKKEHDPIRQLFPKTMHYVDCYKKKKGYKLFSNLLQKAESELMIDGVFAMLNDRGIKSLPIHDAIRVRESDVSQVEEIIKDYFKVRNFNCTIRTK